MQIKREGEGHTKQKLKDELRAKKDQEMYWKGQAAPGHADNYKELEIEVYRKDAVNA